MIKRRSTADRKADARRPRILKVAEAAELLTERTGQPFGEESVRKLIRRKELVTRTVGRHIYIPTFTLERYIAELLAEPVDGGERV